MGGLKPASDVRVKTSQFRFPCILDFLGNARQFDLFGRPIAKGARPVSLGPAARREWTLQEFVGASPPHAERGRSVEY